MRVNAAIDGLAAALDYHTSRVFSAADDEMKQAGEGLRQDLKRQTEDALGVRVANAWRGKFYPNPDDPKGPAAFVWSKAPRIMDFFSSSRVVTPIGQAFAIPTENVPRGPRGRRLSPIEVEARFNAELMPVRLKSGGLGLVIKVIGGRGLRPATRGRRAHGRAARTVLMFVLVRQLRSRMLIDLAATAQQWAAQTAANIERRLGLEE